MKKIKIPLLIIIVMLLSIIVVFVSCSSSQDHIDSEVVEITVKFYIGNALYSETVYKTGDTISAPEITEYENLEIKYWTLNGSWVHLPYTAGTSDLTFVAYTITTINVDFYSDSVKISTTNYNKDSLVQAPEDPVKEGYSFQGWSYNGTIVSFPYSLSNATTKSIQFYAIFEKWVNINYMIDETVYKTYTILSDNNVIVPDAPIKAYSTFVYWVDSNGDRLNSTDTIKQDTYYYAVFESNYYVVNYYVGTSLYTSINAKDYALDIDYTDATYFYGWYTSKSFATAYDFTKKLTGNINLYAKAVTDDYSILTTKLGSAKTISIDTSEFTSSFDNYKTTLPLTINSSTVKTTYSFKCTNSKYAIITYDLMSGVITGQYGDAESSSTVTINVPQYSYNTIDLTSYVVSSQNDGTYVNALIDLGLDIADLVYTYVNDVYTTFKSDYDDSIVRVSIPDITVNEEISSLNNTISLTTDNTCYSVKVMFNNEYIDYVLNVDSYELTNLQAGEYTLITIYNFTNDGKNFRKVVTTKVTIE